MTRDIITDVTQALPLVLVLSILLAILEELSTTSLHMHSISRESLGVIASYITYIE